MGAFPCRGANLCSVLEVEAVTASLSFFPVGNGDMTLVVTEGGFKILIGMNIRSDADDPDKDMPDVAKELRDRLIRDSQDRLYVDVLLVSHPDEDHCRGLRKHFHLGPPGQRPLPEGRGLRNGSSESPC